MGEDDGLWTTLLSKYGLRSQEQQGAIDLRRIEDLVPIDPRISLLLKAMFSSVTTLSDDMLRAQGKLDSVESLRQNRVVINLRKRIQEPPFAAWRDLVQRHKELRMRTLKRTLQRGVVAALNQWADVARERKRMQRFGRRLLSRELMRAWTQWLDVLAGKARLERWLRRALNASLTKSWETWLDFLTARARQQRVLVRAALTSADALRTPVLPPIRRPAYGFALHALRHEHPTRMACTRANAARAHEAQTQCATCGACGRSGE